MIPIIIEIISIILDGLLTNFLPYLVNDLSLFTPLFTIVSIFIIYPLYRKKEKKYFCVIFVAGFIYDLMYTNLLFFNVILFIIIGLLSRYIQKNYEVSYLKIMLYTIIIIVFYESLTAFILFTYNMVPVSLEKVIYKITHSILINIIYVEILYYIINKIPNKYKEININ